MILSGFTSWYTKVSTILSLSKAPLTIKVLQDHRRSRAVTPSNQIIRTTEVTPHTHKTTSTNATPSGHKLALSIFDQDVVDDCLYTCAPLDILLTLLSQERDGSKAGI